jgi:hypothetical protein
MQSQILLAGIYEVCRLGSPVHLPNFIDTGSDIQKLMGGEVIDIVREHISLLSGSRLEMTSKYPGK